MRNISLASIALAVLLMLAGEHSCHAQDLPSGDLRSVKTEAPQEPERDTSSMGASPVFPQLMFGLPSLSRPLRLGSLRYPGDPPTACDIYNMQLAKISGGLYPSMHRNFSATMWTPSNGELIFYSIARLFLTPYASVPYGYWAFNPSFPFASLTKVPDYRDFGNMYSPDLIPQYIRAVLDEQTGIYMQEAVPVEQINTSGWHLGGTDISPVNLGPQTPVERDMQRLGRGYGF